MFLSEVLITLIPTSSVPLVTSSPQGVREDKKIRYHTATEEGENAKQTRSYRIIHLFFSPQPPARMHLNSETMGGICAWRGQLLTGR